MKKISILILLSVSFLLTSCFNKEETKEITNIKKTEETKKITLDDKIDFIVENSSGGIELQNTGSLAKVTKSINNKKIDKVKKENSGTGDTKQIEIGTGYILDNSGSTVDSSGYLIDANGIKLVNASESEETEYLSDEEKEFMKNEIDEVDVNTFVRFKNSIYCKDKNNVYFLIFGLNKLTGVNPSIFKVLQPDGYYWTDGTGIYMLEKKLDIDFSSLKFAVIKDNFIVGGDKNNLYIGSRGIFKGGDINSLQTLSENCLKDNLNVYCSYADFGVTKEGDSYDIIEGVDNNTFEVLDYSYAKDKYSIYFEGEIIDGADLSSFKVFKNSLFARDKDNIYYQGTILEGIQDKNSFKAINGIPEDDNCFYKIDPIKNIATCDPEN